MGLHVGFPPKANRSPARTLMWAKQVKDVMFDWFLLDVEAVKFDNAF